VGRRVPELMRRQVLDLRREPKDFESFSPWKSRPPQPPGPPMMESTRSQRYSVFYE
jgi:hypothetical protein